MLGKFIRCLPIIYGDLFAVWIVSCDSTFKSSLGIQRKKNSWTVSPRVFVVPISWMIKP